MNLAPTTRLVLLLAAAGITPLLLAPLSPVFLWVALATDAALVTLWLGDALWLALHDRLEVTREVAEKLALLRNAPVSIRISNQGRFPLHVRVRDTHPEQLVVTTEEIDDTVPPGTTRTLRYDAMPVRRGRHEFGDIAVWIEGGLRLAARRRTVPAATAVRVFPDLHLIKDFDTLSRRRHLTQMGIRRTRQLGSGREFDRLREYESDDDFRHVNWKATARRGKPITNVYQVERGQDILLALDTSRMMGLAAGGRRKLDAAVEAALFLARAALYYEDNVGLVTFSTGVDVFLPPRRGSAQIGRIVRLLYDVADQPTVVSFRQTFQFIASRLRKRTLVVCFTDLLDEDHARDMLSHLALLRRRHLPVMVTLADQGVVDAAGRLPTNESQAYEAVVAEEILAERKNLARALEHHGALLVDVPAGQLSLATVNTYLQVKAAQLL